MGLLQDLRYAWRSFSATPGVTAVIVMTIAVAVGANTALFSAVYGVRVSPESAAPGIRSALLALDRDQPVYGVTTLQASVAGDVSGRRFTMLLLSSFAGIALVLAAIGIYATLSYTVARRAREIGIRMARGARREDILGLIAREGLLILAGGLGVGLILAFALARQVRALLFGVTPADPLTFLVAASLLLAAGLAGCLAPARRAASVDPTRVLAGFPLS